jgi:hypothetical protein
MDRPGSRPDECDGRRRCFPEDPSANDGAAPERSAARTMRGQAVPARVVGARPRRSRHRRTLVANRDRSCSTSSSVGTGPCHPLLRDDHGTDGSGGRGGWSRCRRITAAAQRRDGAHQPFASHCWPSAPTLARTWASRRCCATTRLGPRPVPPSSCPTASGRGERCDEPAAPPGRGCADCCHRRPSVPAASQSPGRSSDGVFVQVVSNGGSAERPR